MLSSLILNKVAAPVTLKLLRQKNFTTKEYASIIFMFTAIKHYDEKVNKHKILVKLI